MKDPDKMRFETPNLTAENLAKIAELFPGVVAEGKVNFDLLRTMLGDEVFGDEAYEFTWVGKRAAIVEASRPIRNTLRPVVRDETTPTGADSASNPYCSSGSRDWDATENLYIEGDNLDVLKLLQESYLGKVKMVYIDPPYNTGNDFVYRDDFTQNREEYDGEAGVYDEEGDRLFKNTENNGRFHSDWCSMMYPRLVLARNLMTPDAVLLVNIDENEIANLQKICTEVFGESNELGVIVWDKRNPKGSVKGVSYQHEYILVYAKNASDFAANCKMQRPKKSAQVMLDRAMRFFGKISPTYTFEEANRDYARWVSRQSDLTGGEKAYNSFDSNGKVYRPVSMAAPDKPETRSHRPLLHPVTGNPCPVPAKGWRFPDKSMEILLANGEILFGTDETTQPCRKYLLEENMYENISSILYYGGSDTDLLLSFEIPFDTPKVVNIVKEHIQSMTVDGDIILDFFSGSATTAHAVMQLNAEDGGKRKFIMVQLPEITDEKSEAYKAGYKNICEIGKERIRRAGNKILELSLENLVKEGLIVKDERKLSETESMAKGYGFGDGDLYTMQQITENGVIQPARPDKESSRVDSQQCSGGTSQGTEGIYSISENSEGFPGGVGNAVIDMRTARILAEFGYRISDEFVGGNIKNDDGLDKKTKLAALSSRLSTDIGFRVLKLDGTNMNDVYYEASDYTQDMISLLESNIKPDRNDMDLLFGCLLDWGLPLTMPHTSEKIDGFVVHTYNEGDLIACFEEQISETAIREIAGRKPLRAVFRDSSFSNSPEKINVFEIFKLLAPNTTVKVI